MPIPQERDSSGTVLQETLRVVSRVHGDPLAKSKARPALDALTKLKQRMRDRQDADDEVIVGGGVLDAAEAATDRALDAFSRKIIGTLETDDTPGDEHEEYQRIMDGWTPATLLPKARGERTTELQALKERITARKTSAATRKHGEGLLAAIAAELDALAARATAQKNLDAKASAELKAKLACVVAVRELAGALTTLFAADPSRARKLLGQALPGRRRGGRASGAGSGAGAGSEAPAAEATAAAGGEDTRSAAKKPARRRPKHRRRRAAEKTPPRARTPKTPAE